MNKSEKETAALYISACMDDMRKAEIYGDAAMKEKALSDWQAYNKKLKTILEMKWEMFGTNYEKSVTKPLHEVGQIAMVFYQQRVNGEKMKYPV